MLEPVGNKVLIKVGKIVDKVGSIALPEDIITKEQLAKTQGEVIAIGPFAYKAFGDGSPWVSVGDTVYFEKYGGLQHKAEENGEKVDYRIVNDQDIVAIVRG